VQEYVRANHSSELPEIIQVAIESGLPSYLQWLADQVAAPKTDQQVNT
jgi:CutA1 divalent ion tolerance protein.